MTYNYLKKMFYILYCVVLKPGKGAWRTLIKAFDFDYQLPSIVQFLFEFQSEIACQRFVRDDFRVAHG